MRKRFIGKILLNGLLAVLLATACLPMPRSTAAAVLVQTTANAVRTSGSTVTGTLATGTTAGNLVVVICGSGASTTWNGPSGFSTAINQAGTPSQAIFYRIAVSGTTAFVCTDPTGNTSANYTVQVYEYSGIDTTTPLHTTGSASGSSSSASSGSAVTTNANELLIAAVSVGNGNGVSAWSNSFTERNDVQVGNGPPGDRITGAGATRTVTTTGTYSTAATISSGSWRGQIVAFNLVPLVLSVDIVDGSGNSVSSPSVDMQLATSDITCNSVNGTLGTGSQQIRISNTTASAIWTVALSPTSGSTSWSNGTSNYDFNDGGGAPAGCADSGIDIDTWAGQQTISFGSAARTPKTGCTNTGVSLGATNSFVEGGTNSITLIQAGSTAGLNCYWDLTGVTVSQTIPPATPAGTYSINMTLTITAS